jgi:hypothetical protein
MDFMQADTEFRKDILFRDLFHILRKLQDFSNLNQETNLIKFLTEEFHGFKICLYELANAWDNAIFRPQYLATISIIADAIIRFINCKTGIVRTLSTNYPTEKLSSGIEESIDTIRKDLRYS